MSKEKFFEIYNNYKFKKEASINKKAAIPRALGAIGRFLSRPAVIGAGVGAGVGAYKDGWRGAAIGGVGGALAGVGTSRLIGNNPGIGFNAFRRGYGSFPGWSGMLSRSRLARPANAMGGFRSARLSGDARETLRGLGNLQIGTRALVGSGATLGAGYGGYQGFKATEGQSGLARLSGTVGGALAGGAGGALAGVGTRSLMGSNLASRLGGHLRPINLARTGGIVGGASGGLAGFGAGVSSDWDNKDIGTGERLMRGVGGAVLGAGIGGAAGYGLGRVGSGLSGGARRGGGLWTGGGGGGVTGLNNTTPSGPGDARNLGGASRYNWTAGMPTAENPITTATRRPGLFDHRTKLLSWGGQDLEVPTWIPGAYMADRFINSGGGGGGTANHNYYQGPQPYFR